MEDSDESSDWQDGTHNSSVMEDSDDDDDDESSDWQDGTHNNRVMEESDDDGESNEAEEYYLHVERAGVDAVNGIYHRVNYFNGAGRYCKIEQWKNKQREFSVFQCNSMNDEKRWYISIVPTGVQPGTSADIDFYSAPISKSDPANPSYISKWSRLGEGKEPTPILHILLTPADRNHLSMVVSVRPMASTYHNLLFSRDFSDFQFICPADDEDDDGNDNDEQEEDQQVIIPAGYEGDKDEKKKKKSQQVIVHAHRNILAASSPYFKAAFSGAWKDGKHETLHSAKVIRAMLTMIYTGNINMDLIAEEPIALLSVASEYDLGWLRELAEYECASGVNISNVKELWQAGRLFGSVLIKRACIKYAKVHALSVLADGSMSCLQTEDADSWQEFAMALNEPTNNGGTAARKKSS